VGGRCRGYGEKWVSTVASSAIMGKEREPIGEADLGSCPGFFLALGSCPSLEKLLSAFGASQVAPSLPGSR
jgi:hypothetical protein